jgi:Biopolymer transport protein ExbD/TolR
MAGLDLEASRGRGRKSVDSDINMIPMIDLLMVTISFLLITAVWSQMARVDADAEVPGSISPVDHPPPVPEVQLHVMMTSADRFVIAWKQGATTIDSLELTRPAGELADTNARGLRFPELAAKVDSEWRTKGKHSRATDPAFDRAVVHTGDATEFADIVGVIDAVSSPRRLVVLGGKQTMVPAFHVVFAVD